MRSLLLTFYALFVVMGVILVAINLAGRDIGWWNYAIDVFGAASCVLWVGLDDARSGDRQ